MKSIKDKQFYNTTGSVLLLPEQPLQLFFQTYFCCFRRMSHVDLYLEKFSSIYYKGQNFVIREQIPSDLYPKVFRL